MPHHEIKAPPAVALLEAPALPTKSRLASSPGFLSQDVAGSAIGCGNLLFSLGNTLIGAHILLAHFLFPPAAQQHLHSTAEEFTATLTAFPPYPLYSIQHLFRKTDGNLSCLRP